MNKDITINQIVDIFLTSKGLVRNGGDNNLSPILPLIIMDSAKSLFDKYISPVESKREMKRCRGEWLRLYHEFNMEYFSLYTQDQRDYIIDLMDDFEVWIAKHLSICHIQLMNQLTFEPIERQGVLAATLLISILTQSARIVYEGIMAKAGIRMEHKTLMRLDRLIIQWQNLYYGRNKPNVKVDDDKQVCLAVDVLCKQEIYFLNQYKKK